MITLLPVGGLPEVRPGDDLAAMVADVAALQDGDVVVVASKVVSKAEGAVVAVPPGEDRAAFRRRLVEEQAVRVVVRAPWTTIVETRHGLVCANAGIDASNVADGALALLPEDPDASARRLRDGLVERTGRRLAVVVTDTFGRPWRVGQTDVAIGVAGMAARRDERGGVDRFGAVLAVTDVARADEVAAAADLVRAGGKADGHAVVVVRGLAWEPDDGGAAADLVRPAAGDLFPRGRGALADALAVPATAGPPGDGPPPVLRAGDRDRVAGAARMAGGGAIAVRWGSDGLVLSLAPPEPSLESAVPAPAPAAALVALGAAAAAARAALLDVGCDGVLGGGAPELTVTVVAEPAHDTGR